MYEDYLRDPSSVVRSGGSCSRTASWRSFRLSGRACAVRCEPYAGNGCDTKPSGARRTAHGAHSPRERGSHHGGGARLVQNMTESLTVPTATSFRDIPANHLDARRKALNASWPERQEGLLHPPDRVRDRPGRQASRGHRRSESSSRTRRRSGDWALRSAWRPGRSRTRSGG